MTREEIINNHRLIKRFCKDTGLPINVYHAPYFEQRLDILDEIFACKEKFKVFMSELADFKCEQDYFTYYNSVKEEIIHSIKNNQNFQNFNTMKLPSKNLGYPSKDFYKMDFDKKSIISIDMKKANFSALSFFDKDIFDGSKTWEEFIGRFTNYTHMITSKYIRQVIMGTCNPKRQVSYEKYLMEDLLTLIISDLEEFKVYSVTNDEIILSFSENISDYDAYIKVKAAVDKTVYADMMKVSVFHLEKLPITDGWKRNIYSEGKWTYDFKKMNAEYYHQAVKWDKKEYITEDDLVIYHDGLLARLLNPVFHNLP